MDGLLNIIAGMVQMEYEIARQTGVCARCGADFDPAENVVRHPDTGETKVSAHCATCRKEAVAKYLKKV